MNEIIASILGRTIVDVLLDDDEDVVLCLDDGKHILVTIDEDGDACLLISDEEFDA